MHASRSCLVSPGDPDKNRSRNNMVILLPTIDKCHWLIITIDGPCRRPIIAQIDRAGFNCSCLNLVIMNGSVAILDAGAQYCKVIDRRVRELNVRSEILPLNTTLEELIKKDFKAVIISGGPGSVVEDDLSVFDAKILEGRLPVLGICYGMQLMNHLSGGVVERAGIRKDGQYKVKLDPTSAIFTGLAREEEVLLTHGDQCTTVAKGFETIGSINDCIIAISKPALKIYGVQFHPEVDLTPKGKVMLKNFLCNISGLAQNFLIENRLESCIQHMRKAAGDRKVLFLVSGGVDSAVCAAIGKKALKPDQICAIHINNGFMRKNESEMVIDALQKIGLDVKYINASLRFQSGMTTSEVRVDTSALAPSSLRDHASPPVASATAAGEAAEMEVTECTNNNDGGGNTTVSAGKASMHGGVVRYEEVRHIPLGPLNLVVNPEEKRRIIGDVFIHVAEQAWQDFKLNPDEFLLCQGTLRPDLIESAAISKKADVIKTHHNVTEVVRKLCREGKVIEPLADFHKDEVRLIGQLLGLPEELVERHPFPGPGLAVRILCAPCVSPKESSAAAAAAATSGPLGCGGGQDRDFAETTSLVKMIAGYDAMSKKPHALLNKINAATSDEEKTMLSEITADNCLAAHILPIRSVGVQGDCRTYSNACVLSSDKPPNWDALFFMAQIIPRICTNINRVVYAFGPRIGCALTDVTVTYLREPVVATLREVDARVTEVLRARGCLRRLAQCPVILVPLHFDRVLPHPGAYAASVLRSVILRPFVSSDFMTGLPAKPGVHLPLEVVEEMAKVAGEVAGISRVLYDMTSKPPATTEWE